MLRHGFLLSSLFFLSMVGCGGSTGNSVPEDIQPLTEAEQQAADEYTASQSEVDPRTGQPKG